jgi:hypothetical protein
MKFIKLFEQFKDKGYDINEVAWLYFLHVIYDGKMIKE